MNMIASLHRSLAPMLACAAMAAGILAGCEDNPTTVYAYHASLMTIERAEPAFGTAGDEIIVYGRDFGDTSQLDVSVGGVPAEILRLTSQYLIIRVPEGATDGIRVERRSGGSYASLHADFTIIPSPHRYNRYRVAFENMQASFDIDAIGSDDTSSVTTTQPFGFDHSRSRTLSNRTNLCARYGNGDTVRICTQYGRYGNGPAKEEYEVVDERYDLMAVIDTVGRRLTDVHLRINEAYVEQTTPVESTVRRWAIELRLRDIPYGISNGAIVASLSGQEILDHVAHVTAVYSEDAESPTGWSKRRETVKTLLPDANTRLDIVLDRPGE